MHGASAWWVNLWKCILLSQKYWWDHFWKTINVQKRIPVKDLSWIYDKIIFDFLILKTTRSSESLKVWKWKFWKLQAWKWKKIPHKHCVCSCYVKVCSTDNFLSLIFSPGQWDEFTVKKASLYFFAIFGYFSSKNLCVYHSQFFFWWSIEFLE